MWDWGKGTWGGQGVAFGTTPVCMRVQERDGEEGLILSGMVVKVLCSFSPSGDFEKFTYLVHGLWLLTFDGLGFDLLARIVPRRGLLDKMSFIVRLFAENLLLDLAFLYGF
nr:hypothetical protein [Tanacetum cinerariifolium]